MNAIADVVPELFGGAADLTASTKTIFKPGASFHVDPTGRNVFFGVREFGMCAAVNGMAAHGGLIPFGSTFFTFSDYAKPAIRLAALMQTHSLFIFTHDSIGLGEDGPTHQPIEQLMMLRAMPYLTDFRPADANETAAVWRLALERKSPSFMALTRQDLPVIDPASTTSTPTSARAPTSSRTQPNPQSHPHRHRLRSVALRRRRKSCSPPKAFAARVVSLPSWGIFEEQSDAYKASVLPAGVPKVAVEAGATLGWWKYVGQDGDVIGLDRFGASAPGPIVMEKLGFTPENVAAHAKKLMKK